MDYARLQTRINAGAPLRVLFLNDIGFQYGAGLAMLRQVQSFLLQGHDCRVLCWSGGEMSRLPRLHPQALGRWEGVVELPHVHQDAGLSPQEICQGLVEAIATLHPDLVIVGNLHGAKWPLDVLQALKVLDCVTVAYMHDLYLLTGRCAYPGECALYLQGCDAGCSTLQEYPPLEPEAIAAAWQLRRDIFCGQDAMPLAANSRWCLDLAIASLPGLGFHEVVYLGLDEGVFSPIDKSLARTLLALPQDRTLVAMGAVNLNEKRKGWDVFKELVPALGRHGSQARVVLFGENSLGVEDVHAVGLVRDFRKMPLVYAACDVYVTTSMEEAFGQTIVEAQACGKPVAAFAVGGVPEACDDGDTATLATEISPHGMLAAIENYLDDPDLAAAHGQAGRQLVASRFTLRAQAAGWMTYLQRLCKTHAE